MKRKVIAGMHNMLKVFFDFLAKRSYDFFNNSLISKGDKFFLNLDSKDDVNGFYNALDEFLGSWGVKSVYKRPEEFFETYQFQIGGDPGLMVVVVNENHIKPAYMINLRNRVPDEGVLFVVCSNPIDSIRGGAESLSKEGMPFNKGSVTADIKTQIDNSSMTSGEKLVLCHAVKELINSDAMDMYSLNDFEYIVEALSKGGLEDDDFYKFGMFSDEEIKTISFSEKKELESRIDDNRSVFKKIDEIVKYRNSKEGLDGIVTDDIKKRIYNAPDPARWDKGITYKEIEDSLRKLKTKTDAIKIARIAVSANNDSGITFLNENVDFFVRYINDKAAGLRKPQILIFNNRIEYPLSVMVELSAVPVQPEISFADNKAGHIAKISGKKVIVEICKSDFAVNKVTVKAKEHSEKIEISYFVINSDAGWFKDISSHYIINASKTKIAPKSLVVLCDEDIVTLNSGKDDLEELVLAQDLVIDADPDKTTALTIDNNSFDEKGIATVSIVADGVSLPVTFMETTPINSSITSVKIEQKLLSSHISFEYRGNNKLVHGTSEYNTREELKDVIEWESQIVNGNIACGVVDGDGVLTPRDLDLSDNIRNAYNDFIGYFKSHNTIPSLAYYNDELRALAEHYVNAVLDELGFIEEDTCLSHLTAEIMKLGVITLKANEIIAFSSVHPINVAHKLTKTKMNGDNDIREDVLRKFSADNLVPFIHDEKGNLYKVREQTQAINWVYFSPAEQKRFKGSRNYVVNLVAEKIVDFHNHFKYLFDSISGTNKIGSGKIIINAINMGDCKNLLMGILHYFKSNLKDINNILSVVVNIYDDINSYNAFEILSNSISFKSLLEDIGSKSSEKDFSVNEFSNLVMTKLQYFRKRKSEEKYEYCHLAFIEMDSEQKTGTANKSEIKTGTMLDGLMSGVTSMYYGENHSYRTGYGSKFNPDITDGSHLIALAELYNSAMVVFGTANPYNSKLAVCTSINEQETEMINKTYDAANWVVFVDPKVDLNYFKNNDKDVMIIHYSDQHTTSSGYDAITVTRKTEQYENILREFMLKNNISADDNTAVRKLIDMFNAVNGDWLLKLISSKSNFPKEKISIQSAIKLALAFLKKDNIIWIPISIEEVLRVSGSIGLAKNDGLFSAQNLGYKNEVTSDDLLMFGVEAADGNVMVHLYPLEVKIGYKDNNEVSKAIQQIHNTRKIFDEKLTNSDDENILQTKFYRNFIAQLAIISAQKLELYNVWDNQDWERVVGSDIRGKLLNDDFSLSTSLRNKIGEGLIISFKNGALSRNVAKEDNVTVIKFLYSDGIEFITKDVDEISESILKMHTVKDYIDNSLDSCVIADSISAPDFLPEDIPCDKGNFVEIADDINTQFDGELSDVISELFEDINTAGDLDEDFVPENAKPEERQVEPLAGDPGNADGMRILFGTNEINGQPLYWYPNDTSRTMHPNTGIIGTMGSGKTQFTKSLIYQLVREQKNNPGGEPLGILIFDYKGDYNKNKQDFVDATGANVYSVYQLPFNPFAIVNTDKPLMPVHIANTFADTLKRHYNLGVKQVNALNNCIEKAYSEFGIDSADQSTWNKPAPTFEDVYKIYTESEFCKDDSLNAALSKLHTFRVFESDTAKTESLYDLINGVAVIDLSTCESSMQNLVVALTLDLFYSQMRAFGHSKNFGKLRQLTKFILVDEADNFLRAGFPSVRNILKEGREFGVGTILSTQFIDHFDTQDDDFAKYILTWIVHKVTDLTPKNIKNLFNTSSKSEEDELISTIQQLNMSYSIVKMGNASTALPVKDKPFWKIIEEQLQNNTV